MSDRSDRRHVMLSARRPCRGVGCAVAGVGTGGARRVR
jgi:hypothetical protein